MSEKYAPGFSVESITDNELRATTTKQHSSLAGVHDHPLGKNSEQLPNNAPTEDRLQDYTPDELRENLDRGMMQTIIHDYFEMTRWKFTPRIISYLDTHPFSDKTSINAIFEELHQVIENSSMAGIFAASDSQMDLPSGPDGNI